ncbi:ABC transporter ATP-binding protein [Roseivirga sp.]|uniref:ABC transporter ATP-binding protein n=1 Tax=Roseivirga sp. TaxID=1964215 RepID=UPI002B2780D7|nr:ATP-binding cassette domain-containing protein [Roseivirga sp.]
MPKSIIRTTELDFYFKDFKALDKINLNVPEGSIYGFLGPNGAGKTTTIRILLDLFHSKPGQVKLFGQELLANKVELLGKVGALIENPSIYKHLTGRQNLEVVRRMIGAPKSRIDEVLKIVRLTDNANKKAKNYSLGMCQRLGLASALLNDPDLLILDEPTNGLDPSGIIEMRELIIRLNKEHGKTIFLSSHILTEIEKMATDVAIIDQGKIMYEGKLDGLHSNNPTQFLEIKLDNVQKAIEVIKELSYTISEQDSKTITLPIADKKDISKINKALVQNDIEVYQLKSTEETLEAIFLNLTKKLDQ